MTEEEKKNSPNKVTLVICTIILAFFTALMLNTWIDYKIKVETLRNIKDYHQEEIQRLEMTIEMLKLLKNEDLNATK